MLRMAITLKTLNAFPAMQRRRIPTAVALQRRASQSNSVALVNKKIKLQPRHPTEHAKTVIPGRTLHLVQIPAARIQAVVRKQITPPDLQVQVLQPPALATTVIQAPTLDLLQETVQAGRTLMRLLVQTGLSGPPALALQTAVAWNAALARSPPATTTPAPRTQAVVRKQITPPD